MKIEERIEEMEKDKEQQRIIDYSAISDLCRYSQKNNNDNSICPLIYKKCDIKNCPLYFITSLKDADRAADDMLQDIF